MKLLGSSFLMIVSLMAALPQSRPEGEYWVYVAAESEDQVAVLRFAPDGFEVRKTIDVGVRPTEIEGPHGVRVSPDGKYWYVSLAHGNPFGSVHKYRTGDDAWEGFVEVGMFPATMDIAASTGLLWVANFDLHGGMTPGTISIVETTGMLEVGQVEVGIMPHGSRLNENGDRHWAVMMMSDELVETDAFGFEVVRRLPLGETGGGVRESQGRDMAAAKPTWVEPSPDGRSLYVALNGADLIREIDLESWSVTRTFATAPGPYNLGVTPDGRRLVVSYRTDGTTGIWDLGEGTEVARVRNARALPHGIAVSPDSRYAFVSVEGVGAEPGAVDVIDLDAGAVVASADIGKQGSGIAFWKLVE